MNWDERRLSSSEEQPNYKHYHDCSALWNAAKKGDLELVRNELRSGCYVNSGDENHYGRTALMYACMKGHIEVVSLLLTKGADPDMICRQGRNASDYAEHFGHQPCVDLITTSKEEQLVMDLDSAIRTGSLGAFRTQVGRMEHCDEGDECGWTMLMKVTYRIFVSDHNLCAY